MFVCVFHLVLVSCEVIVFPISEVRYCWVSKVQLNTSESFVVGQMYEVNLCEFVVHYQMIMQPRTAVIVMIEMASSGVMTCWCFIEGEGRSVCRCHCMCIQGVEQGQRRPWLVRG